MGKVISLCTCDISSRDSEIVIGTNEVEVVNNNEQISNAKNYSNQRKKDENELDETLYKIGPPAGANSFFPEIKDIFRENVNEPHKSIRIIFDGKIEYSLYETTKLNELSRKIEELNKENPNNQIKIPLRWPDSENLRILQSTFYDISKSVPLLKDYIKWRSEVDSITLTKKTIEILNTGFLYNYGYDNSFRPIVYLNFNNYKNHFTKFTDSEYETAIIYFMEYVVKNLFVPGQVETWVFITDKGDYSIFSIPPFIKKISSMLQNNYRARLHKGFVFGLSGLVSFLWGFIKVMVDANTVGKITLIDNNNKHLLFEEIDKKQIEMQYGGESENIKEGEFFPPKRNTTKDSN